MRLKGLYISSSLLLDSAILNLLIFIYMELNIFKQDILCNVLSILNLIKVSLNRTYEIIVILSILLIVYGT